MEKYIKVTTQINLVVLGIIAMLYLIAATTCRTDEVLAYCGVALTVSVLMYVNVKAGLLMMAVFHKKAAKKVIEE